MRQKKVFSGFGIQDVRGNFSRISFSGVRVVDRGENRKQGIQRFVFQKFILKGRRGVYQQLRFKVEKIC